MGLLISSQSPGQNRFSQLVQDVEKIATSPTQAEVKISSITSCVKAAYQDLEPEEQEQLRAFCKNKISQINQYKRAQREGVRPLTLSISVQKSTQSTLFHEMPVDILALIVTQCAFKDLLQLRRTCRSLYHLSPRLLSLHSVAISTILNKFIARYPSETKQFLEHLPDATYHTVDISLSVLNHRIYLAALEQIARKYPCIKSVKLQGDPLGDAVIGNLMKLTPKAESLEFDSAITPVTECLLSDYPVTLQSLSICVCIYDNHQLHELLKKLALSCPNLAHLALVINGRAALDLSNAPVLKKLTSLELSGGRFDYEELGRWLSKHELTTLRLKCVKFTEDPDPELSLPTTLKVLEVYQSHAFLSILTDLSSLEELHLNLNEVDYELSDIALPNSLKKFTIEGPIRGDDEDEPQVLTLVDMLQDCTQLSSLIVKDIEDDHGGVRLTGHQPFTLVRELHTIRSTLGLESNLHLFPNLQSLKVTLDHIDVTLEIPDSVTEIVIEYNYSIDGLINIVSIARKARNLQSLKIYYEIDMPLQELQEDIIEYLKGLREEFPNLPWSFHTQSKIYGDSARIDSKNPYIFIPTN